MPAVQNQFKKSLRALCLVASVFTLVFFVLQQPSLAAAQGTDIVPPITEQPDLPPPTPQPDVPPPTAQPDVTLPQPEPQLVPPITPQPDLPVPTYTNAPVVSVASWGDFIGLGSTDPRLIIAQLIRVALSFLGIVFLVMILLAGFTYLTAGGNDERAASAKHTLFNAIIGIIIILSANSIVMYVVKAFNGTTDAAAVTSPATPTVNNVGL